MVEEGDEKIGDSPDELRCSRSDGRQWRCKRRVVGELNMCAYHLYRCSGKSRRGGRLVERKVRGLVDDGVKLILEGNGVIDLGDGVNEVMKSLDGEGGSVSISGRKKKGMKRNVDDIVEEDLRYGNKKEEGNVDDVVEEDLSRGSKKEEGNVDDSMKKFGGEEVGLVAEGCSVSDRSL